MTLLQTARHVITIWSNWRSRKKLYKVCPALSNLDQREAQLRKAHKSTKAVVSEKRRVMTARLKWEAR